MTNFWILWRLEESIHFTRPRGLVQRPDVVFAMFATFDPSDFSITPTRRADPEDAPLRRNTMCGKTRTYGIILLSNECASFRTYAIAIVLNMAEREMEPRERATERRGRKLISTRTNTRHARRACVAWAQATVITRDTPPPPPESAPVLPLESTPPSSPRTVVSPHETPDSARAVAPSPEEWHESSELDVACELSRPPLHLDRPITLDFEFEFDESDDDGGDDSGGGGVGHDARGWEEEVRLGVRELELIEDDDDDEPSVEASGAAAGPRKVTKSVDFDVEIDGECDEGAVFGTPPRESRRPQVAEEIHAPMTYDEMVSRIRPRAQHPAPPFSAPPAQAYPSFSKGTSFWLFGDQS